MNNDPTKGGYECRCPDGFRGDGYAIDQSTVMYGSALSRDAAAAFGVEFTRAGEVVQLSRPADATDDWDQDGNPDLYGCTDINDCASNPCQNGAQCIDRYAGLYIDGDGNLQTEPSQALGVPSAFYCDCARLMPGKLYEGEFCEVNVNECEAGQHYCQTPVAATCIDNDGSFTCHCNDGWEGDGRDVNRDSADRAALFGIAEPFEGCTDIDDCTVATPTGAFTVDAGGNEVAEIAVRSPCENGGTCQNDGEGTHNHLCYCVEGWEGSNTDNDNNCEVDVNECERFDPYTELGCHDAAHCVNNAGSYECICNNGWTGNGLNVEGGCYDADDCEFSPCQHGGSCMDCGTLCLICDCVVGWRGRTCEIDWNECKMGIHTCNNFAECFNTPGSFECQCEPGYSGDGYLMCNEVDDCLRWEDDAEIADDTLVDWAIKDYDDEGNLVRKEQEVAPAAWADDRPIAVVQDGQTVQVHQCGEWDAASRVFTPHGTCTDTGPAAFQCQCDLGWTDSNCDLDVDECARSVDDCHKYASCINLPGSFVCQCNLGYTGDGQVSCTDIDDCSAVNEKGEKCMNGRCSDLGPGDFRCICLEGWMDRLCNEDIDECASFTHTCTPDVAICTNMPGSFKCACRTGFDGDGIGPEGCIDIDDCGSSPCENGVCQDNGRNSWSCTCDNGWIDTMCDHDANECYSGSHDCHPQAKCVNTPGGFYCRCVSGHTGDGYTCTDLDDCDPDPCDPEHGTCHDNGANRYSCACSPGFAGMGCENDEVECQLGTHACHPDADCFNSYGSYICACKDEFYGDGVNCAPCTDCELDCADGEERSWINLLPAPPAELNKFMDPTGYACGHGPGYENDKSKPACAAIDRECAQINECQRQVDNCDPDDADCVDNEGSFTCECRIQEQKWGTGLAGECYDCTECELGQRMLDDCTTRTDRACRQTIYDGNYAIQTTSGGTAQCLVHWKEAGKLFPERYSWGGRLGSPEGGYGSQSIGKYEMWGGGEEIKQGVKSAIPAPDLCDGDVAPICGVCNYGGQSPGANIVRGMEAAWTFLHLKLDLYLILNAADGNGFRCLGFQTPDAPYPTLLTWAPMVVQSDTGICVNAENELPVVGTAVRVTCTSDAACTSMKGPIGGLVDHCKFEHTETGEWRTDVPGPESMADITTCKSVPDGTMRNSVKNRRECELKYFCGFETNEAGPARTKLMSNGGTVWNVKPLACQGKYCQDRWTEDKYLIRSAAVGDANGDLVTDHYDYRCLYFSSSIPEMTPISPSVDGVWMGAGGSADVDGNGDPDCGIALRGVGGAAQNERLGISSHDDVETQEKELMINGQAVFGLVRLPDF